MRAVATGPKDAVQALLERLETGELGDPLPILAYLAGQTVVLPQAELNESRRRAVVRLASLGDPAAGLEVDGPAVKDLAVELYTAGRRAQLGYAVDRIALRARELPTVREAALFLASERELAWRLFALALLAEELGE
jgi:hypothetical protein